MSWHSKKLKRICRSSTSAEVQSCANGYDDSEFVRQLLYEFESSRGITAKTSDEDIARIPAAVVCDAKNMYDSVTRITSSGLQLEEKRLCLEVWSIRERASATNAPLKWVNSNHQMADDLTKVFEVDKMLDLLQRRTFSIVFDDSFTSAKKENKANQSSEKRYHQKQWKQEENKIHVETDMD